MLVAGAILKGAPALCKYHDEPGRGFQMWFVRIGPDGLQGFDPRISGCTVIEPALFFLRGQADFAFQCRVSDCYKMPGLMIGTAWSGAGRFHASFDNLAVDRSVGELANSMTLPHIFKERGCPFPHVGV